MGDTNSHVCNSYAIVPAYETGSHVPATTAAAGRRPNPRLLQLAVMIMEKPTVIQECVAGRPCRARTYMTAVRTMEQHCEWPRTSAQPNPTPTPQPQVRVGARNTEPHHLVEARQGAWSAPAAPT